MNNLKALQLSKLSHLVHLDEQALRHLISYVDGRGHHKGRNNTPRRKGAQ
ncbi:hypothetical protein PH5382_02726 [Phaeobacter sp. CECT 5382]|nr:hypothetical protein PH5382_02726 [Phaeobacter sp. CECT 5382]